ncbi:response regulator receiver domain-containing protein [Maribacter vaceletii]|uniref:Response regulator receiver domain-containing protein n=1 Tax=Maribacter vaceletii TaxID=1206816 RepID=A0A495EEK9_9FLAO|nr:response regulator [Maribacter vaceletii]RKR15328.1 response regulator receiver domain-containing protein [Maribacter vaceletii]
MSIETICIIDDDPIFIFGTKILLNNNEFCDTILVSNNGQEGVECLESFLKEKNKLPELIFLDLNMPVLDGWGFLDAFNESYKDVNTKIYILSSSIDSRDIERAKQYSLVEGFIAKPLTDKIIKNLKINFQS